MSLLPNDIKDDEIRIISSEKKDKNGSLPTPDKIGTEYSQLPKNGTKDDAGLNYGSREASAPKPKWKLWLIVTAIIFFGGLCVFFWWEVSKDNKEEAEIKKEEIRTKSEIETSQIKISDYKDSEREEKQVENVNSEKGYVNTYDTIINKIPLTIYAPKSLKPKLHIGKDALKDTTASFVVQAADIRRDNGQIVGAYVSEGNLLSRGQSKAGFCAIINGKLIIGVADSTPYLEQAIETGGYFFRQYPLVVGGQVVENKLKSSSLRKALAELNGEIVVIMNDKKQTLNDFSQTLVDLGVTNAIYLVGSTAPGFAVDKDGKRIDFGKEYENPSVNSNYLIWN